MVGSYHSSAMALSSTQQTLCTYKMLAACHQISSPRPNVPPYAFPSIDIHDVQDLEIHNSRIVVMSGMVAHDHGYCSMQNSGAICRTRSNTATVVVGVSVVSIETTVMVYFPVLIN